MLDELWLPSGGHLYVEVHPEPTDLLLVSRTLSLHLEEVEWMVEECRNSDRSVYADGEAQWPGGLP